MGRLRRYIEGKQGHVASTLDGVSMYVIGQYGKFAQRSSDAQFNAKTSLRIPVTSTSDVVTVVSYPGYHNYKVGGVAASADKTTHKATTSEVSQGYVEIFSTGNSYLFSISVVQYKYVASFGGTGSNSNGTGNTSGGSNFGVTGISNYDLNSPVGWGTYGGSITGSKNQNAVTVTTADQLVMALSGTDAKPIYVKGNLTFNGQMTVNGGKNKTVYGLPGSVLNNATHTSSVDKTGILCLKNCKNIIMRNLTFKGAYAPCAFWKSSYCKLSLLKQCDELLHWCRL